MFAIKSFGYGAVVFGLFAAVIMVGLGGQAKASPLTLSGGFTAADVSVNGTLDGNLSGNVLTLNNAPPVSHVAIDVSGAAISAPSLPTFHYSLNCGPVSNCFSISVVPNLEPNLVIPTWNFGVGGTVDFNASTANLTIDPLAPKTVATLQLVSKPTFYVSSNILFDFQVDTINAALNAVGNKITVDISSAWDSVTPGTANASMSQNGSDIQLDLGLTATTLNGHITIDDVNVAFTNTVATMLANFGISFFDLTVGNAVRNALSPQIVSEISALDFNEQGFQQDCTGHYYTGNTVDVSCVDAVNFSYTGPLQPARVAEPGMLALFGLGSLALAAAAVRRRRQGVN